MSTSRNDLKSYFKTGLAPTQGHFEAIIDSCLNKLDDKVTIIEVGNTRHLGLGTTNPQSPLSIVANEATNALIGFQDDNGVESWGIKQSGSNANASLIISELNSERNNLCLHPGGNIGIGSPEPNANLDINSAGSCWIRLGNASGFDAGIEQEEKDLIISASRDGKIIFGTNQEEGSRPSTGSSRMITLDGLGKLGIGTGSPLEHLHVGTGKILIGDTDGISNNILVTPDGLQGREGTIPGSITMNTEGGNVGIGMTDPIAKVHIHSSSDNALMISGTEKPSIFFKGPDEKTAQIRYEGDSLLNLLDTSIQIHTTSPESNPTFSLVNSDSDSGSIQFTNDSVLIIKSGSEENPGNISFQGNVAFGAEFPESKLHIVSMDDNVLMLEGSSSPSLKFKGAESSVMELVYEEKELVVRGSGEGKSLQKVKFNANVDIEVEEPEVIFSVTSVKPTLDQNVSEEGSPQGDEQGDDSTDGHSVAEEDDPVKSVLGIFLEAKTNPAVTFKGENEEKATMEFLDGSQLKFSKSNHSDLEKYTFHGNMDIQSAGSQTGLSVATSSEAVEILANVAPGINLKSAAGTASIQFNEGALMLAGPQDMKLTGTHINLDGEANISENAIVKGDLEVQGSTTLDSISVTGQVMTKLIAKEDIETKKNLISGGDVEVKKQLNVTQKATLKGAAQIEGDTTLKQTLNVTGLTSLNAGAAITGDVNVAGKLDVTKQLNVTQKATLKGAAQVDGDTTLKQTLNVAGLTSLNAGAAITGDVNVAGKLDVTKQLNVTQKATLKGAAQVDGDTMLKQTLNVAGLTSLNAGAAITGDVNITGKLDVTKDVMFSQLLTTKDCSVNEDLQVIGQTTLDGLTKLKSGIDVTGTSVLRGKLELEGTNGEIVTSKKISAGESLNSQNGVIQRDVFAQKVQSRGAISLGTNIKKADARIFRLVVEGCNVSNAKGIFSELSGTSGSTIESINHADGLSISYEYDDDDQLLITLTHEPEEEVEAFISVSAWLPDAFDLEITKN